MGFKRKPILKVFMDFDLVRPKCGPYEASQGIYPGHGQKKRWARAFIRLTGKSTSSYNNLSKPGFFLIESGSA
jgi:hypothetical protein